MDALDPQPRTCESHDCARPAEYGFTQCERCMRRTIATMELDELSRWFVSPETGPLATKLLEHPDVVTRVMRLQRELETL